MSLLAKIKNELSQLGIKPSKSLGQNFLVNEGIYEKIVTALNIESGDTIIEVGPGLGTLTDYLAQSDANIFAIEKDRHLISHLKNHFVKFKNVRIMEGDILMVRPEDLAIKNNTYKLVGNIPYYITSHLLRIVFEKWPMPDIVVFMIQKEVARRIVAKPGEMSLLAASIQYYAKPEVVSYVSRGSFYPAPDVDSAIIKLTPFKEKNDPVFEKKYFEIIKRGFAGKRKQLQNNLVSETMPKEEVQQKLTSIDIDPRRRAETLSIGEWKQITNLLF